MHEQQKQEVLESLLTLKKVDYDRLKLISDSFVANS